LPVKYKLKINQEIKYKKAKLLLNIILNNLGVFGLTLIEARGVNQHGVDIVASAGSKNIGIELKAYNLNEKLKVKDINQVERFINKEKLDKCILITTTNIQDAHINYNPNIEIIFLFELKKLLSKKYSKQLNFITTQTVNITNSKKKKTRKKILEYVKNQYLLGNAPSHKEICKTLKVDIRTYFDSLTEIYKELKLPAFNRMQFGPKSNKFDPEIISMLKEECKKYILKITKTEKRYPTGVEIGKQIGINHIWNYIKINELYAELNLPNYLERKKRKLIAHTN
jgi:hypothetical protein